MSSLAHHGVKGQKWGVRRYQNPDGTRTDRGKKQAKLRRLQRNTSEDFISIRKTLSDDDLRMLNYSDKAIKYMRKNGSLNKDPITSATAHRVIQKDKNGTPVTYIEGTGFTSNSLLTGKATVRIISIDLATRSGEEYRGKGHAVAAGKKMVKWFDRYGYKEYEYMEWAAKEKNIASQKTAEKIGFKKLEGIAQPGWTLYAYAKHSSIGGNMNCIYGNTLILGDSSYLAHHGILGQKWGIRRFQNKDGSRTAEGKKRYRSRRTVFEDYQNAQLDNVISNNKYNYKRHPIKYNPIKRSILKKKAYDLREEYDDVLKNGRTNSGLFQKPIKGSISLTANEKKETLDAVRTADIEIRNPKYRFYDKVSFLAAATEKSTISACKKLAWYDAKRMDNEERRFVISEDLEDMYASFKKKNPGSQKGQFEKFNKIPEVKKLIDESDRLFDENEQLRKEQDSECHRVAATVFDTTEWAKPFGEPRDGYTETYLSVLERAINVNSVMYASRTAKKNIEPVEAKRLGTYEEPKHAEKEQRAYDDASKRVFDAVDKADQALQDRFKETDLGKKNPKAIPHIDGYTTGDISSLFSKSTEKQIYDWIKKQDDLREPIREAEEIRSKAESKLRKKVEHTSMGGNMNCIYGNTLVLGDSSYLEHHGIKNQKWGVRRFQNPDGSLTAAGRIRYGVTGAAKAAFKVGKKLGSATASAAKAGVKKAKDNAYAKKKEKVSRTREGVLKNKKMFTADELKALENRFKIEDEMSEASLRHGQAVAKTVSQYANTTRDVLSALQTGGNAVSAITKAFADIQSYQNAKGVAEAAKEKGMTTKEFDLFLKEKYPNAKKDDGSKKKDKNSNKAKESDSDDNDDDNPPNNGGGGGSKKQAKYESKRQAAQEAIYAKRKADLDSRESGLKQREDYVNKRYDALLKVSKQRQSEQDARDEDLNRRDKAASERESKLKETAKIAADVMSKLNKRQADLDKKESFLNSIESYRLDTLSEFKKNEEEAARRKKKNAKHSAIGEEMYTDHLEHHGIKGQRWGVRRFQNADGSLTDKGRKHYQKKLALEERKLTAANAARGQYERVRTPMSVGMGILGAVAGAMVGVPAGPAGIAAGAAIVSSIAASSNYAAYTVAGIVAGHGAKRNMKKIAKYKEALAQDAFEIQNGVLIYGSGQSEELKHFGLKGMKWGVRRFQNPDGSLTDTGKKRYSNTGELDSGGGGGGSDEEDEETKKKIEKAMNSAYRKSIAGRYDTLKAKRKKKSAKHSAFVKDGTLFLEYRGTNFPKR